MRWVSVFGLEAVTISTKALEALHGIEIRSPASVSGQQRRWSQWRGHRSSEIEIYKIEIWNYRIWDYRLSRRRTLLVVKFFWGSSWVLRKSKGWGGSPIFIFLHFYDQVLKNLRRGTWGAPFHPLIFVLMLIIQN
jgi:hypothetical protein